MLSKEPEHYLHEKLNDPLFTGGTNYVSQVCIDGMQRVVDRIGLEKRNIAVKNVPVGGMDGTGDLFEMFRKARHGFRLLSRVDDQASGFDPEKFLGVVGKSREDQAAALVAEIFPERKITRPNEQYALSVFFAFSFTLQRLVQSEMVNFYSLGVNPTDDSDIILTSSYWQYNYNPEFLWRTIWEMEGVVRKAVLHPGFLGNNPKLFQAAHFLAANLSYKDRSN